jgi:thioredoxin 1
MLQHDPRLEELQDKIKSGAPVVLDFHATWCGPCKMIAPRFQSLSELHKHVSFYKIDIDKVPEAASHFNISAMPTFIAFKDGKQVKSFMGADSKQLESLVAQVL